MRNMLSSRAQKMLGLFEHWWESQQLFLDSIRDRAVPAYQIIFQDFNQDGRALYYGIMCGAMAHALFVKSFVMCISWIECVKSVPSEEVDITVMSYLCFRKKLDTFKILHIKTVCDGRAVKVDR